MSFNSTAASALSLLTGTARQIERSTIRVGSGKEVDTAADNAAYWSIATGMGSYGMALSSAQDAGGLAAATADTAALGMEAATALVSDIQAKLVLARSPGVDRNAVNAEIGQLKQQLGSIAQSASFSGENWLATDSVPGVTSLVASMSANADGSASIVTIDVDRAETTLVSSNDASDGLLTRAYSGTTSNGDAYDYYLLDSNAATPASPTAKEIAISDTTTDDEIDGMIAATDRMLSSITDAGARLGATQGRISSNSEFLSDLQDTITLGIGRLVDADIEESVVRMNAQKAQEQLQTIGLNIANDQSKALLSLFR